MAGGLPPTGWWCSPPWLFYLISGTLAMWPPCLPTWAMRGMSWPRRRTATWRRCNALTARCTRRPTWPMCRRVLGAVTEALLPPGADRPGAGEGPAAVLTGWLGRGGAGLPANGGHIAALRSPGRGEVAEAVLAGAGGADPRRAMPADARLVGQNASSCPAGASGRWGCCWWI